MKAAKFIWRFLLGGATTAAGWIIVQPNLTAASSTTSVSTVIGIGLIAVGISVLSAVFD